MSAPYAVRVSGMSDAEGVSALLEASYSQLLRPHYTPEVLAVALPLMTKANPELLSCGQYYVAEAPDGKIVGCGGWTVAPPGGAVAEEDAGHIRHFGTHPDFARMGIASALMRRCLDEAASKGVRALECQSTLAAERFYASAGFRRIEAIRVPLSAEVDYPAVRMRLELGERTA